MTSGRRFARAPYNAAVYPAGPPPMTMTSRISITMYSTYWPGRLFPYPASRGWNREYNRGSRAKGRHGRHAQLEPPSHPRRPPFRRRVRNQLLPRPRSRGLADGGADRLARQLAPLGRGEADRGAPRPALARRARGAEARPEPDQGVLRQRVQPRGRARTGALRGGRLLVGAVARAPGSRPRRDRPRLPPRAPRATRRPRRRSARRVRWAGTWPGLPAP